MKEKTVDASYALQAHKRRQNRRIKIGVAASLLLAAFLFWLTGIAGTSFTVMSDMMESMEIALYPGNGYPVQMDASGFIKAESMQSSFAVLGEKDVILYSKKGNVLQSFAHGYGQPGLTAGKTRACVYNRGGNELTVLSRLKELGSKTLDQPVYFAFIADNGTLAVATQAESHKAKLTVYTVGFDEIWQWRSANDYPVCGAFSSNNRTMAVACLTPDRGTLSTTVYLLDTGSEKEAGQFHYIDGIPLELHWLDGRFLLVLYDSEAVLYDTHRGEKTASYRYPAPLVAAAQKEGNIALLCGEQNKAAGMRLVILNQNLQPQADVGPGKGMTGVTLTEEMVCLQTQNSILYYSLTGELLGEEAVQYQPLLVLDCGQLVSVSAEKIEELTTP